MEASDAFDRPTGSLDEEPRNEEWHEEADDLARRIEATIRSTKETLDDLPEFEDRHETDRSTNMRKFREKFGTNV